MTGDLLLSLRLVSMMTGVPLRLVHAILAFAFVIWSVRKVVLLLDVEWVWKLTLLALSVMWVKWVQVQVLLWARCLLARMLV